MRAERKCGFAIRINRTWNRISTKVRGSAWAGSAEPIDKTNRRVNNGVHGSVHGGGDYGICQRRKGALWLKALYGACYVRVRMRICNATTPSHFFVASPFDVGVRRARFQPRRGKPRPVGSLIELRRIDFLAIKMSRHIDAFIRAKCLTRAVSLICFVQQDSC